MTETKATTTAAQGKMKSWNRKKRTTAYEWSDPKEHWPRRHHVERMTRNRFQDKDKRLYVRAPTTSDHFAAEWVKKQLQAYPKGAQLFWVLSPPGGGGGGGGAAAAATTENKDDGCDLPTVHGQRFLVLFRAPATTKDAVKAQLAEVQRELEADDQAHAAAAGKPVAGCLCAVCLNADGIPSSVNDLYKGSLQVRIDNHLKVNQGRSYTLHAVVSNKPRAGAAPSKSAYAIMSPV